MDRHLVAVEVGIECGTNQRMQLQGAALHQNRLKRLNTQTVQGRRTVHQHGVVLDDNLQRVPNLLLTRSTILRALDIGGTPFQPAAS